VTITVEDRDQLHQRLKEVLGPKEAAIIMEHLPPVGWADVATKRDLDQMAVATKRDLDLLKADVAAVEDRIMLRVDATLQRELRLNNLAMLGGFSVLMAMFTAINQLR
jgi:hypothetical protein